MAAAASVDEYLASFPAGTRAILELARATIHEAAPGMEERISYGIPTFTLDGHYVIYLAGWQRHISVYPIPGGDPDIEREVAPYADGRGTLKFPLDRPIPYELIGRVAALLLAQRRAAG